MSWHHKPTLQSDEGYKMDQVVINKSTIVYTKATKCNNVIECMDGKDENGCNNTILDTIFIGNEYIMYIVHTPLDSKKN